MTVKAKSAMSIGVDIRPISDNMFTIQGINAAIRIDRVRLQPAPLQNMNLK